MCANALFGNMKNEPSANKEEATGDLQRTILMQVNLPWSKGGKSKTASKDKKIISRTWSCSRAVVDVIKLFFGGNVGNLDFPLNRNKQF